MLVEEILMNFVQLYVDRPQQVCEHIRIILTHKGNTIAHNTYSNE